MIEALGTIAHSGTKAFLDKIQATQTGDGASLIGQFGVGFYSAFMVAERVDVFSRRVGASEAWQWSSDGKGAFSLAAATLRGGATSRNPRRAASHARRHILYRPS